MLHSSLTSIENRHNNFANIKEEAIGLAKKWGITPEFEKKRHRKVRQFFDDFNTEEKLQDRERLFEVDVFKANVNVITTQLKNRSEKLIAFDRQEGLFVYSRVLVIMYGRRPRQDHPLGQDIVTGDEVPQHQP
ncbi:hypothetical protein TNCV_3372811 [Trichonephila clavipes]|nr:hypothetical protein TNCV_3372811 [Trichonephila clavipes]